MFDEIQYLRDWEVHLAEAAIFAQWQHSPNFRNLRYARWKNEGEVDVVYLKSTVEKPLWLCEIKWSDRVQERSHAELKHMRAFMERNGSIEEAVFTTRTFSDSQTLCGVPLRVMPSALYCYAIGRNIMTRRLRPA